MNDEIDNTVNKNGDKPIVIRNTTDLQRLKLEKLMKNPDKPVVIPERPKGRSMPNVPDFVRNVMGSSAGAGSGEFHVYRHLRRKEYARQKFIQEKSEKERLNDQYHEKLENNRILAEEKTAKKRAKRLKRKQRAKEKAKKPKIEKKESESSEESENSDENETEQHSEQDSVKTENDTADCKNLDIKQEHDENINKESKNKEEILESLTENIDKETNITNQDNSTIDNN